MPRRLLLLLPLILFLAAGAAHAQQGPSREVTVANETDRTLQQLYAWRTGTSGPGEDRLGANVLPPRGSLRVALGRSTNCNWEIRGVFEDGEEMQRRVNVCRSPRAVLAETGPRREVEVANDADLELRELYLSPPGSTAEVPDRLGSATVPGGEVFRMVLRGDAARGCVWDVRGVFMDDSEDRRPHVDLCRTPRIAFGDPDLPVHEVPVLNRARRTLRELYASAALPEGPMPADRAWGADRLGSAVVSPRESFRLRVRTRDCVFDIRGVYDNDSEEVQRRVDLCAVQGVVFGEAAGTAAAPRQVTLRNRHGRPIQAAYVSPTESQDWGDDVLGDAVLPVGEEVAVQAVSGCRADLRIVFDNKASEERREVDICATPVITLRPGWTVEEMPAAEAAASPDKAPEPAAPRPDLPVPAPAPEAARLRLRNAAALPVVELYVDAPGSAARGPDRLGAGIIDSGKALAVAPPADLPEADRCHADVTAVFRDGRQLRLNVQDLCAEREVVLQ